MLARFTMVARILGAFGMIVLVLFGVLLANIWSLRAIERENSIMMDMRALDAEFVLRELQHFQWAANLRDFIDDEAQTRLGVETDYRRCGLGSWFYGDGRRRAEALVPALAPLLPRLEQPHIGLHQSAVMVERIIAASRALGADRAREVYAAQSAPALRTVQSLLAEIRSVVHAAVERQEAVVIRTMRTVTVVVTVSLLLCIMVVAAVGFLTRRGLVAIMAGVGREMAEGSNQVSAAAGQVATSSQSLAEGSTEQAASVEEVSATLEEVTSMTRRDADNIQQADSLMQETGRVINAAMASMQRLVASMREISEASSETQKIVKTIDEIAFQTNLLALNAAVEAARAGEAGAGFAVVADEVRNLAMRAAEAAQNTSGLIEGTVAKIESGSSLVDETGTSFRNTAESVVKVSVLIREIATSSSEQTNAVSRVASALGQIETVVQRNAATAEEAASASEELSAQAATLRQTVREMIRAVGGIDESIFVDEGGRAGLSVVAQSSRPRVLDYREKRTGAAGRNRRLLLPLPPSGRTSSFGKPAGGSKQVIKEEAASEVIPFDNDDFKNF